MLLAYASKAKRELPNDTECADGAVERAAGAEPWTEQMRSEIEERMDMHAVEI